MRAAILLIFALVCIIFAQINIAIKQYIDLSSIILCAISLISLLFVAYEQHKA